MSDQTDDRAAPPGSQINILAQYVRDISFENPLAPDSLRTDRTTPKMDINIGVDARKVPDDKLENMYESVMNIRAIATVAEDQPVFIIELVYGTTVVLKDVPEENHHPVMLIEVPRLSFPYVRQILSDLTQQGGFPPLMINPVDFQQLYMERYKDEIEAAKKSLSETGDEASTDDKKAATTKSDS